MSVAKIRAILAGSNPRVLGLSEKPKPGIDGAIT
jgi:hypothetical protein